MIRLRILFFLTTFILCAGNAFSQTSIYDAYNALDESEQIVIDTIIYEFNLDHYEFLGEKSTIKSLLLAVAVPFDPEKAQQHEESEGHVHDDAEKLNVAMVRAADEDEGDLIVNIGPYKLTYKTLYTVGVSEKEITFQVTNDEDYVPGRKPGEPDPKIIERIANRLQGTIHGSTITLP